MIDYIDMSPARNQREVENRTREAMKLDRARIQIGKISRFGLLEMSRQRLRPSLGESSQIVCPRCEGHGTIRNVSSLALSILRVIEEEAMKDNTTRVETQMPVAVATYLLNEKRDILTEIEQRQKVKILLIPNINLETPHYTIERIRENDDNVNDDTPSYELADKQEAATAAQAPQQQERKPVEEAAIKQVAPATPRPVSSQPQIGIFTKIWLALFGTGETKKKPVNTRNRNRPSHQNRNANRNRNQRRSSNPNRRDNQQRQGQAKSNKSEQTNKPQQTGQTTDTKAQTTAQQNKPQQNKQSGNRNPRRRRGGSNQNRRNDNRTRNPQADKAEANPTSNTEQHSNSRDNTTANASATANKTAANKTADRKSSDSKTPATDAPLKNTSTAPQSMPEKQPTPNQRGNAHQQPGKKETPTVTNVTPQNKTSQNRETVSNTAQTKSSATEAKPALKQVETTKVETQTTPVKQQATPHLTPVKNEVPKPAAPASTTTSNSDSDKSKLTQVFTKPSED